MPPAVNIPPTIASLFGISSIFMILFTLVQRNNTVDDSTHSGDISFQNIVNWDRNTENYAANSCVVERVGFNVDHRENYIFTINLNFLWTKESDKNYLKLKYINLIPYLVLLSFSVPYQTTHLSCQLSLSGTGVPSPQNYSGFSSSVLFWCSWSSSHVPFFYLHQISSNRSTNPLSFYPYSVFTLIHFTVSKLIELRF